MKRHPDWGGPVTRETQLLNGINAMWVFPSSSLVYLSGSEGLGKFEVCMRMQAYEIGRKPWVSTRLLSPRWCHSNLLLVADCCWGVLNKKTATTAATLITRNTSTKKCACSTIFVQGFVRAHDLEQTIAQAIILENIRSTDNALSRLRSPWNYFVKFMVYAHRQSLLRSAVWNKLNSFAELPPSSSRDIRAKDPGISQEALKWKSMTIKHEVSCCDRVNPERHQPGN